MRRFCVLLLLAALVGLSACAQVRETVVLLPDPDGKVGKVSVAADQGEQELTKSGQATQVTDIDKEPTKPETMDSSQIKEVFGRALAAQPQQPTRFILYFKSDSTKLTDASQAKLPEIVEAIKEQDARDVSVIGHADRAGDERYNVMISSRRAAVVRKLLIKMGVRAQDIESTSHGERYPLIPTPDGKHEPRNRRVEVVIR